MINAAWSLQTLELTERGLFLLFACFMAVWILALGAAIGSFLNVIIYRLPRGMSLIHPTSRCPACQTPIRPIDNIPILAWLRLRGRCRACGAPISIRYPIVEGLIAILLFALAWCEIHAGGINLPGSQAEHVVSSALRWKIDALDLFRTGYHGFLLVAAVALAYIAWDGFPPPRRLMAAALIAGIVTPLFAPAVWPVESGIPRVFSRILLHSGWGIRLDVNALAIAASGLASGVLAGALLGIAAIRRYDLAGIVCLASLAGLYLGWQALITYAPIAGILALMTAGISRSTARPIPATVACAWALIAQVFGWRRLAGIIQELAGGTQPFSTSAVVAILAAIVLTIIPVVLARVVLSTIPARLIRNGDSRNHDHTRDLGEA